MTESKPELVVVGRRRFYKYEDVLYPSVSTVLKAYPKPALISWATTVTAEYAVQKRAQIFAVAKADEAQAGEFRYMGGPMSGGEAAAVELLKGARFKTRDTAAARGTDAHAVIASGGTPTPDAAPYVAAFERWVEEKGAVIVAQEFIVISTKYAYGGTADLCVDLDGGLRPIIDVKTRPDSRVFPDQLLQSAAYASCDVGVPLGVNAAGVLTVTPNGCELHLVEDLAEALVTFRAVKRVAVWEGMLEPHENEWGG